MITKSNSDAFSTYGTTISVRDYNRNPSSLACGPDHVPCVLSDVLYCYVVKALFLEIT